MNIAEQFNMISKEYDSGRRMFIPCFDAYYDATTRFVVNSIEKPSRILDLGAGTGLLTSYWLKYVPDAEYVLTDIAEGMLEAAKMRFAALNNVTLEVSDYRFALPSGNFDAILSALSIHHLEQSEKQELFQKLYAKLPSGGVFINYDQFCGTTAAMSRWYDTYWVNCLETNGLTTEEIRKWKERRMLDRECSVPAEIEMLQQAGFQTAECIFTMQKFSVIFAMKE